jgi:hypothetical protein
MIISSTKDSQGIEIILKCVLQEKLNVGFLIIEGVKVKCEIFAYEEKNNYFEVKINIDEVNDDEIRQKTLKLDKTNVENEFNFITKVKIFISRYNLVLETQVFHRDENILSCRTPTCIYHVEKLLDRIAYEMSSEKNIEEPNHQFYLLEAIKKIEDDIFKEVRVHKRFLSNVENYVYIDSLGGDEKKYLINDISQGGLSFKVELPVEIGNQIQLRVSDNMSSKAILCQVMGVDFIGDNKKTVKIGVKFLQINSINKNGEKNQVKNSKNSENSIEGSSSSQKLTQVFLMKIKNNPFRKKIPALLSQVNQDSMIINILKPEEEMIHLQFEVFFVKTYPKIFKTIEVDKISFDPKKKKYQLLCRIISVNIV